MGVYLCRRVSSDEDEYINRRTGRKYYLSSIPTEEGVVHNLRSEDGNLNIYADKSGCLRLMEFSDTFILG